MSICTLNLIGSYFTLRIKSVPSLHSCQKMRLVWSTEIENLKPDQNVNAIFIRDFIIVNGNFITFTRVNISIYCFMFPQTPDTIKRYYGQQCSILDPLSIFFHALHFVPLQEFSLQVDLIFFSNFNTKQCLNQIKMKFDERYLMYVRT